MSRALRVLRCGPGLTVQDLGRPGLLGFGLSRGGAADRLALAEGAALLSQKPSLAALEMPGGGGEFEAEEDLRVAFTGAPMRAQLDGAPLAWNASHLLPAGAKLSIGGATAGSYGYLHVGGGFETPEILGSRSAHLGSGVGRAVEKGDELPVGRDEAPDRVGLRLDPAPRLDGGAVRIVASPQTELFSEAERARFEAVGFRRDARGNRMGVRLLPDDGAGFASEAGLSVLSEPIVPGDIQITGDGAPFVLLAECQTTGGYPRIGTVLPADLPRVAQARAGAALRFTFVTLEAAWRIEAAERKRRAGLRSETRPLVRRLEDIRDLLSYQLISGMTAGDDMERSGR